MSKIIITGVSSFVGYHLADMFNTYGHEIIGTTTRDIRDYESIQKSRISNLEQKKIQLNRLDLRVIKEIELLIENVKPDYWIHHAGFATNYSQNNYDIEKGMEINVYPLFQLIPFLRKAGCKGIIITGTNAEYTTKDTASEELEACYPSTPYGVSKLTETIAANQLSNLYEIPVRVARIFIPFGTLDSESKLLPYLVRKLKAGEEVELTPCQQKRDFIYVKEITNIYKFLISDFERKLFDIINISSGEATQLKEFILKISNIMGKSSKLLNFGAKEMRPGEPNISYGSNRKLINELNYTFQFSQEKAIIDYLEEIKIS